MSISSSVDYHHSSYSHQINYQAYQGSNENIHWTYEKILFLVIETIVAIFAVVGNVFVIIVFCRERRLRRKTNYYIISLASADFCVGLFAIPFAVFWVIKKKLICITIIIYARFALTCLPYCLLPFLFPNNFLFLFILQLSDVSHHSYVCLVPILTSLTLCNISVFSLLLISIDRILVSTEQTSFSENNPYQCVFFLGAR